MRICAAAIVNEPGKPDTVPVVVSGVTVPIESVTATLAGLPTGRSTTVTSTLAGSKTVTEVLAVFVASCVDVAVAIAVPAAEGVNWPEEVIVPPVADHVTEEL
jgi:hypothetical protein